MRVCQFRHFGTGDMSELIRQTGSIFESRKRALGCQIASTQLDRVQSLALEGFQLVQSARPVRAEQARKAAVSQHFSSGLALGAVVGLVVCVANALHFFAATRAWLTELSMDGHLRPKGRYFFRKALLRFADEPIDP